MLPAAVAQTSSDYSSICYVRPVWWVMLCFHIMGHMVCEQMEDNVTA